MNARARMAVWGMPAALAVVTVFGLLSALLGSEAWRWPACACLALPVAVGVWHAVRPQADDEQSDRETS